MAPLAFVCTFSELDEVPKRYPAAQYREAILKVLKERKRFSCFEVDMKLARALEVLHREGKIRYIHEEGDYYFPWTGVEVIKQEADHG